MPAAGRKTIPGKAGAGRPRDPGVENRILDVALAHLRRDGYARMSIDAVAAEAGASKPTLYRRWTGKADLALAALERLRVQEPAPRGRTAKARLTGLLENFRGNLLRPNGMALIGTVLAEEGHTPELLALFRQRIVHPRRTLIRQALTAAVHTGELPGETDIEASVAMLIGSFYAAYLAGTAVPASWPARIVEQLWRGRTGSSRVQ